MNLPPFFTPMPRVVAHRGDSITYPENTISAFLSATDMGVDVIETDTHLSKDGHLVIWHDPTLERNTNGSGKIEHHTLAELKTLDAGYTFTTDGITFPYRGSGITLATLDEALSACPKMRFNVDLKSKEPEIVEAFFNVVKKHQAFDRVVCASFHLSNLRAMRKNHPEILTSITTTEVLKLLLKQKLHILGNVLPKPHPVIFQVPVAQWGIKVITPDFVNIMHNRGAIIQVWTINEPNEMRRLWEMGVDSIMTDDPKTALAVAAELTIR